MNNKLHSIQSRCLQQKNVLWNNAKLIPIKYNELQAEIHLFPTQLTHKKWNDIKKWKSTRDPAYHKLAGELVENLLVQGDLGFLKISDELKIQIVVTQQVERHRHILHEHINFNAQLHTAQVHTQRSDSCCLPLKDECFSFTEFA